MEHDFVIGSTTRPYNQLSFAAACERIASAGYADVAVFAHGQKMPVDSASTADQVADVRKAAADAGLRPSMLLGRTNLTLGLDGAIEDYRRLLDNALELGAEWILELGTSREEEYADYPRLFEAVAPHAADAGVSISLKPHGGISLTARELVELHDRVNHPAFRICYDPGNIIHYTRGEVRPEGEADVIASRTSTLIIKDCDLVGDKPNVMVTAGDGLVDFPVVLRKLTDGGFRGPMYVECVGSTEPDAVDRDLAFTRGFVTGILKTL